MAQQFPGQGTNTSQSSSEASASSYPHNDDHSTTWGSDVPNDTPIARAWARLFDAGLVLGPPTSREYTIPSKEGDEVRQNFQYGYATLLLDSPQHPNPNLTVRFSDARGFIAQESGI